MGAKGGGQIKRIGAKNKMKRILQVTSILLISVVLTGCGYSVRSASLGKLKTIYIEPFKNKISYGSQNSRNIYLPLLEVNVTNAIIDRYLFDGNLKIGKSGTADLVLKGELLDYHRDPLRYTDSNDVQEYRITITIAMTLFDNADQKVLWTETGFAGDTTYFTTGAQAKSETTALQDALTDLARRVVERTVENW